MNNVARSLTDMAAQLLQREEREAILGDLAEAGESAWRGLSEVLGLVARRQLALWNDWRPWVAAFGVSLPGSLLLMGVSVSVSCNPVPVPAAGDSGRPPWLTAQRPRTRLLQLPWLPPSMTRRG